MESDVVLSPSFTGLDFAMIGVVVLSAGFGFIRGFTREVLTVGGWIMAAFVTLYSIPFVKPWARHWVGHEFLGDVLGIFIVFLLSLVVFSLIIRIVSEKIRGSLLGGLDRSLGVVFGTGRGFLLLVIAYGATVFVWPAHSERPKMVQQAKLTGFLSQGAGFVLGVLPRDFVDADFAKALKLKQDVPADEMVRNLAKPQAGTLKKNGRNGYTSDDREHLEELFKEPDL